MGQMVMSTCREYRRMRSEVMERRKRYWVVIAYITDNRSHSLYKALAMDYCSAFLILLPF